MGCRGSEVRIFSPRPLEFAVAVTKRAGIAGSFHFGRMAPASSSITCPRPARSPHLRELGAASRWASFGPYRQRRSRGNQWRGVVPLPAHARGVGGPGCIGARHFHALGGRPGPGAGHGGHLHKPGVAALRGNRREGEPVPAASDIGARLACGQVTTMNSSSAIGYPGRPCVRSRIPSSSCFGDRPGKCGFATYGTQPVEACRRRPQG